MKPIPRAKSPRLILTAMFLAAALAGCSGPVHRARPQEATPVHVISIRLRPVGIQAHAIGTVVSADRVAVSSRLMGYIRTMHVHIGQTVSANQPLFQVDPISVHAQINGAAARLTQAQAEFSAAESTYRRFAPLLKTGAVAPQEFDRIRASRNSARAAMVAAKSALLAARSQLAYARVVAPVAGVVVRKMANRGDLALPGHPVLVLDNPLHRQVQFSVTTSLYRHIRLGERVDVQDDSHTEYATVERMVEAADPVTHTHLIKASLSSTSRFPVGAFVTVAIRIGEESAVVVPRGAIHTRAGLRGVFVVTDHDRAQFRLVRTGGHHGALVTILSGLAAHERLVVSQSHSLHNGELLHVIGSQE